MAGLFAVVFVGLFLLVRFAQLVAEHQSRARAGRPQLSPQRIREIERELGFGPVEQ